MKNKKALIVTHPHEYFDVNRSIEPNLESFVSEHRDYDIIRLMDPTLKKDIKMFNRGDIIWSEMGEVCEERVNQLAYQYDLLVTAGGFFYDCALQTFGSLINYKQRDSQKGLRIVVPLDLHYINSIEKYLRKSQTMQEYYLLQEENPNKVEAIFDLHLFALELKKSHKIPPRLTKSRGRGIELEIRDKKILIEDLGLKVEFVVSYKDIPDL